MLRNSALQELPQLLPRGKPSDRAARSADPAEPRRSRAHPSGDLPSSASARIRPGATARKLVRADSLCAMAESAPALAAGCDGAGSITPVSVGCVLLRAKFGRHGPSASRNGATTVELRQNQDTAACPKVGLLRTEPSQIGQHWEHICRSRPTFCRRAPICGAGPAQK